MSILVWMLAVVLALDRSIRLYRVEAMLPWWLKAACWFAELAGVLTFWLLLTNVGLVWYESGLATPILLGAHLVAQRKREDSDEIAADVCRVLWSRIPRYVTGVVLVLMIVKRRIEIG